MKTIIKLGLASVTVFTGIVLIYKTKKTKNTNPLGFDLYTPLNHSSGSIDFAKQLKNEIKHAIHRFAKAMTKLCFGTSTAH